VFVRSVAVTPPYLTTRSPLIAQMMGSEENSLLKSLGLYDTHEHASEEPTPPPSGDEEYDIVSNPNADLADFSELRGVANEEKNVVEDVTHELDNLAELVPDIKHRRRSHTGDSLPKESVNDDLTSPLPEAGGKQKVSRKISMASGADSTAARRLSAPPMELNDSMKALESRDMDESSRNYTPRTPKHKCDQASSDDSDGVALDDYPDSVDDDYENASKVPKEFLNMRSDNSISTATQTHEVRMPMYLPTFKPATGCTNASDFIVRCFIARLRSGVTVVKHGRSRWCKSRLRVLHIHPDGRSLSWKPADGEPNSSKRPPKLDLSTCLEVRHAWSPDPQNPMYTGTSILRQKCEAANAHKSFALIFKQRTVDITAVTADQCKVLMEGFSALCFRLQVATLAGRGAKKGQAMPEEDGVSTTASATLTNSSTPRGR
jgi:hypothetical protein